MTSYISGFFVFIIVAAAIVGVIYYARWWNQHGGGKIRREQEERRKAERAASVRARGWQYDGTIDGNIHYRISGQTEAGHDWRMHYDSDHSSSSSSPKLIFLAPWPSGTEHQWIIHDRKTWSIMQKSGVRAVVGGLAMLASAFSDAMKAKRDFYLNAEVLPAGGFEFRERYVLAGHDARWRELLDGEIERLILDWPEFKQSMSMRDNCFSAELVPEGLRVQLYADAPDIAVIQHMAKLGQRLTDKAKSISPA